MMQSTMHAGASSAVGVQGAAGSFSVGLAAPLLFLARSYVVGYMPAVIALPTWGSGRRLTPHPAKRSFDLPRIVGSSAARVLASARKIFTFCFGTADEARIFR
jgi:hypothetical protein